MQIQIKCYRYKNRSNIGIALLKNMIVLNWEIKKNFYFFYRYVQSEPFQRMLLQYEGNN